MIDATVAVEQLAVELGAKPSVGRAANDDRGFFDAPPDWVSQRMPYIATSNLPLMQRAGVVALEELCRLRQVQPDHLREYGNWWPLLSGFGAEIVIHPDAEPWLRSLFHELSGQPGAFSPHGVHAAGYDEAANDVALDDAIDRSAKRFAAGDPVKRLNGIIVELVQQGVIAGDTSPGAITTGKLKSPIAQGHTPPITSIDHIMDEMPAMAAMNGRFAVVHDYGGQSAIVTFDGDGRARVIDPDDMKTSLANRFVRRVGADGVVKLVQLVDFWLRHPLRREYDRATYDPENTRARPGERTLNLFRGLAREPRRALWSKMRRHLWLVVCRRDRKAFNYLLMWLAHAVQRPGTAPGTVIVLKSAAEGSGKSIVGGWMHSIFDPHSLMLNDPEQLLGRFNGMLEAVSFLIMNEPTFPGDHKNSRKLKAMVTEPVWLIERKYRQAHAVPNIAHIMLTTNEEWVVPAGSFVRRYLVLEVDPRYAGNHAYFEKLVQEADSGGIEAMLGFLLALDISGFKINDVPTTAALIEQQLLSAPLITTWALDMAENTTTVLGIHFGADNTTESLLASFSEYVKARGGRLMSANAFGRWLGRLGFPAVLIGAGRQRGWAIPDASTFQQVIRHAAGIRVLT